MNEQAGPSAKRFKQDEALVKIIYISELKRNGSSQYFSQKGANVDAIYGIFKKFGSIESVEAKRRQCRFYRFYCAIEFNDAEIASGLLEKGRIKIDGSTFHMSSIDKPYQPTDFDSAEFAQWLQQPSVPAQDSPKNILNALNDDCLCEIFRRIDHLADIDAIANVCVRFRQIALLEFSPKIRSRCINIDDFAFDNGFNADRIKISQLENFLSTFGSSIASLKFRPFYMEETPRAANLAIQMVDKYCKNVRHLDIEVNEEQHEIADYVRSIFSKLHVLHIRFARITRWEPKIYDLISVCSELVELNIQGSFSTFRMTDTQFPQLTKFTFNIDKQSSFTRSSLVEFLLKNPQIGEIDLHEKWIDNKMMNGVLPNMWMLRKIKYRLSYGYRDLSRFEHAKIDLGEGCYEVHHIPHPQNITKVTLRTYSRDSYEQNLLPTVQTLYNLEELTIEPITFVTIKEVVRHSSNLEKLNIQKRHSYGIPDLVQFDKNMYNELLEVILARQNHKKLTITLEDGLDYDFVRRPSDLLKKFADLDEHPSLTIFRYYINVRGRTNILLEKFFKMPQG